jgi:hypothetical protein
MRSALFVFALMIGGLSLQGAQAADSTATTPLPDAPYEVLAHPSGYFFRLSRKTGLVWYLAKTEWKSVPVNTAFTVMDLDRPYPPQFQLIANKTSVVWINCTDGKSAVLEITDTPANWRFVDVVEPKR